MFLLVECLLTLLRHLESMNGQLLYKSVLEVPQFLGLANNYRHFIKDFATIAKPLHQATEKKHGFKWTEQCTQTFNQLKDCLTSSPILVMPDWTKPFILDTDACDVGIGAILFQCNPDGNKHVIAYASRLLTKPKRTLVSHARNF